MNALMTARYPLIMIGREVATHNVQDLFAQFISSTRRPSYFLCFINSFPDIPFISNSQSKSVLSEEHEHFIGYLDSMDKTPTQYILNSDLFIEIGSIDVESTHPQLVENRGGVGGGGGSVEKSRIATSNII